MENVSFYLDPATDDIVIENGTVKMVTGSEEVVQAVWLRLRTWRTEWYLNIDDGIPYYLYWEKGFPPERVHYDVLMELYKDPRVESVLDIRIEDFDTKQRQLTVKFVAKTVSGAILRGEKVIG